MNNGFRLNKYKIPMLSKIYKGSLLNTFLYENGKLTLMPFDISLYVPNVQQIPESVEIKGRKSAQNRPIVYKMSKENETFSAIDTLDNDSDILLMDGYEYKPIDNVYYTYDVNFSENRRLLGNKELNSLGGLNYVGSKSIPGNSILKSTRRDPYISMDKFINITKEIYSTIFPKLNRFAEINYSELSGYDNKSSDFGGESAFFSKNTDANTPITIKGVIRKCIDWITDIPDVKGVGLDKTESLGLTFHRLMYCSVFFLLHQFYFYDVTLINTTVFTRIRNYIASLETTLVEEADRGSFQCLQSLSSNEDLINELLENSDDNTDEWILDIIDSLTYIHDKTNELPEDKNNYGINNEMSNNVRSPKWVIDHKLADALWMLAEGKDGEFFIDLSMESRRYIRAEAETLRRSNDLNKWSMGLVALIPLMLQSYYAIFYDNYKTPRVNIINEREVGTKKKETTIQEATIQKSKYTYSNLIDTTITTYSATALDGNLMRLKVFIDNIVDDIKLLTCIDDVHEKPDEISKKLDSLSNFLKLYLSENPLFCLDVPKLVLTVEHSRSFLDKIYQDAKEIEDVVTMFVVDRIKEKCDVFQESVSLCLDSAKYRKGIEEIYVPNTKYNYELNVYPRTDELNKDSLSKDIVKDLYNSSKTINQAEGICNLLDQIVYDSILISRRSIYALSSLTQSVNADVLEQMFNASTLLRDFLSFEIKDHNIGRSAGNTEVSLNIDLFKFKYILEYLKNILYWCKMILNKRCEQKPLMPENIYSMTDNDDTSADYSKIILKKSNTSTILSPYSLKYISDNADSTLRTQDCVSRVYSGEKIFNLNLCRMYLNQTLPFDTTSNNQKYSIPLNRIINKLGSNHSTIAPETDMDNKAAVFLLEYPLYNVIKDIHNYFYSAANNRNNPKEERKEEVGTMPGIMQVYDRLYNNLLLFVGEVLEYTDIDKSDGHKGSVLDSVLTSREVTDYYKDIIKHVANNNDCPLSSLGAEIVPPTINVIKSKKHFNSSTTARSLTEGIFTVSSRDETSQHRSRNALDFSKPVVLTELNATPINTPSDINAVVTNTDVASELTSYYKNSLHGYKIMDINVDMVPDIILNSDIKEIPESVHNIVLNNRNVVPPLSREQYLTPEGQAFSRSYFFYNLNYVWNGAYEIYNQHNSTDKNFTVAMQQISLLFENTMCASAYSRNYQQNKKAWDEWFYYTFVCALNESYGAGINDLFLTLQSLNLLKPSKDIYDGQNYSPNTGVQPVFSLKKILRPSRLKLKLQMPMIRAHDIKRVFQNLATDEYYSAYTPSADLDMMTSRTIDFLSEEEGKNIVGENYETSITKATEKQPVPVSQQINRFQAIRF